MRVSRKQLLLASIVLISFAVIAFVSVRTNSLKVDDRDPDSLLKKADDLSWNNNWIRAEPLYHRAELLFAQQNRPSQALYAHASQIPPNAESSSLTATIFGLTEDLARPEAADPETRLQILTIRGMLEVNYDAASSRSTWTQVAELARRQHHYQLAVRAVGEQGISAFLLGVLAGIGFGTGAGILVPTMVIGHHRAGNADFILFDAIPDGPAGAAYPRRCSSLRRHPVSLTERRQP